MPAKTVPIPVPVASANAGFHYTVKTYGRATQRKISTFMALLHFFTGKWLQSGDAAHDLRGQLITEQTSISLVAALFATISIPAVFAADGWDQDWKQGVYGFLVNFANSGLVASVLSSVLYILAINECMSDYELRRFVKNMGPAIQIPTVAFLFGVILFGGITMCFYCYRTYPLYWFISYGICSYLGSSLVLLPAVSVLVKSLYAAKEGRHGRAVILRGELRKAIALCITDMAHEDAEMAEEDDVREWILSKTNCLELTELTERRFLVEYEEVVKEKLGPEYEVKEK